MGRQTLFKKIQAYLKALSTAEEFVVSQPQAIKQSFLSYILIQVNIIAVRFKIDSVFSMFKAKNL